MDNCKNCSGHLFSDHEKKTGTCNHCRSFNSECVKCKSHLFSSEEKDTGVCNHCKTFNK